MLYLNGETQLVDALPLETTRQLIRNTSLHPQFTRDIVAIKMSPSKRLEKLATRRALANGIDRFEFERVLRWPHFVLSSLNPLLVKAPETWSFSFGSSQVGRINHSSLKLNPGSNQKVGTNIQAQLNRNLGMNIAIQKNNSAELGLVTLKWNPYLPFRYLQNLKKHLPQTSISSRSWNEKKWNSSFSQYITLLEYLDDVATSNELLFPLFLKAEQFLLNPNVKGLNWCSAGNWDFSRAHLL